MRKTPYRAYLIDEEIEALYEILGDQKNSVLRPFIRRLEVQMERIEKDKQIEALLQRQQPARDLSLLEASVQPPTPT